MSDFGVTTPPARPNCSGEAKLTLPANRPPMIETSVALSDRAMPKSMILARRTSPSGRMMLSGEMSRWTSPLRCETSSADAIRLCRIATSASGIGPALQLRRQRRAVDELHRQIGAAQVRIDREHEIAHDRFVRQVVQRRRLAPEQLEDFRVVGELGPDQFDRHGIARQDVEAAIDLAHPAVGDQLLDFVDAVELRPGPDAPLDRALDDGPLVHRAPQSRNSCVPPRLSRNATGAVAANTSAPKRQWERNLSILAERTV